MTTNTKFPTAVRRRGQKWNDTMRDTEPNGYNNRSNPLPTMFAGKSPNAVNTLLHLGWNADDTLTLLNYADATGDQPDWSAYDWDELLYFFQMLEVAMSNEAVTK